MSKLPMYLIVGGCMSVGGIVPSMFGESAFGGWSIFGTVVGGIIGVVAYWKIREAGYIS